MPSILRQAPSIDFEPNRGLLRWGSGRTPGDRKTPGDTQLFLGPGMHGTLLAPPATCSLTLLALTRKLNVPGHSANMSTKLANAAFLFTTRADSIANGTLS